jgi:hypothetical protein
MIAKRKFVNSGLERQSLQRLNELVKEYLYIFGYEDPSDRKSNMENGTDYESSRMIRILASSEEEALLWGDEIAERYVQSLFGDMKVSWKADRFASWIENSPDAEEKRLWDELQVVNYGEFPNFTKLEEDV